MSSPFDVLGIDPDAEEAEVVRAYRRRVKETHPDRGGSAREFRRVKRAYERIQNGEVDDPASGPDGPDGPDRAGDPTDEGDDRGGRDDRAGRAGGGDAGDGAGIEGSRVEYLNYQVLADHGWELADEGLFAKAADAGLDPADYGRLFVEPGESLLEAAENRGFAWPYACRGGACTNCAVAVLDGEMPTPTGHILPQEMLDRGIRLSCLSAPITDDVQVVYNVKHLPGLDELRLPPSRFNAARSDD